MKASWTTAWAVRWDGAVVEEYRVAETRPNVFTVRAPDATRGGGRWVRATYEKTFGATRREAIEQFRREAECDIALALEELKAAQAMLARAAVLAAKEPKEQVQ